MQHPEPPRESSERVVTAHGADETARLGRLVGERVTPGFVLDLRGPLGAGKTTFVRAVAAALGVARGVASPTFTICRTHRGPVTLHHVDAYRLDDPQELLLHGWDEMIRDGVVAVEWGERAASVLPSDRLQIDIEHGGVSQRTFRFRALGPRARVLLEAVWSADPKS